MNEEEKLFQAVIHGDQAAVIALLDSIPTLKNATTPSGVPAILFALYYEEPEISQIFQEHAADVNIFTAAALGQVELIQQMLTNNPALVNAEAPDGFSPLGLAAFFGATQAASLLLEHGAQVNRAANNPQKVTPLHSAVAGQHFEIAQMLLNHGADANARQMGDFTPLQGAAQNGQIEMIELLVKHGADLNLRNADGHTALGLSRIESQTQAFDLLRGLSAIE